ncbi:MAG: tripartite tricarboxylate transporter substrate binding protein [Betaproteobacteria bacterium]|nr:tripartite tricarboxylate transporter substrate binding protein [Betaproteobacteria bacterium]MBI2509864.1 tripartite tricarboxylate transporter substrate binding protein [Betaproteobacteria bacterium]
MRVIVGLAPGGGTDIQARLLAQRLSANLNRSFIVDNRTGAGGTVAYALVAKSPADGYTLLAVASGYSITPAVYSKLPYDPIKDFAPISLVVQAPILLMTHPSLPVKSTRELVALAKARPGVLNSASAGYGTSNHLALELFNLLAGTRITHVPYKGTGPALIDAMAGQVHVIFGNILSSLQYVRQGRLKALAVTSVTRSKAVPELPTVAESGVPGYETTTWHGWLAPAGTPAAIVNRMSAELAKAVKAPDVQGHLAGDGGEPIGSNPEQFAQHLAAEIARWRKVVTDAGISVQ